MPAGCTCELTELARLDLTDPVARVTEWQSRPALRLEAGMALLRDLRVADALVELDLGVDPGGAYPGLAFRGDRPEEMELLYCQPHTSGQWDALQYDPLFHGTNTWQVFHGPGYQAAAEVPAGRWFTMQVELRGPTATARIVGDTAAPLVVPRLAHGEPTGRLGVWTFRPAYFAALRVLPLGSPAPAVSVSPVAQPPGLVAEWDLAGYGRVAVEPHGVLNLLRYLTPSAAPAVLRHPFTAGDVELHFGFSDTLTLRVDGEVVFTGEHRFRGFGDRVSRGYVALDAERLALRLEPGQHLLTAEVGMAEGFGWGFTCAIR